MLGTVLKILTTREAAVLLIVITAVEFDILFYNIFGCIQNIK